MTFADWVGGALHPPPTTADLDYHVSTLFPPVRPHGHLEVRYVDAQPGRQWALPVAVLGALLSDPDRHRARPAGVRSPRRVAGCPRPGTAWPTACCSGRRSRCSSWPSPRCPRWSRRRGSSTSSSVVLERRVRRGLCPADLDVPDHGPPAGAVPRAPDTRHDTRSATPTGDPEEAPA